MTSATGQYARHYQTLVMSDCQTLRRRDTARTRGWKILVPSNERHTLPLSNTHTPSLSHTHSFSLTHTHPFSFSHTLVLSHTHTPSLSHKYSLSLLHTLLLSHAHTPSLSLSLTHTLFLSFTHTLSLARARERKRESTRVVSQGTDCLTECLTDRDCESYSKWNTHRESEGEYNRQTW